MSTKDLFKKGNKVLTKSQEAKIKSDLESTELVRDVVRANNKFHSHIDYSKPENFAFYGSAQKYYEDSFNRVYQTYPYDGSLSEKEKWLYDSSELDLWILDNAYPKAAGHVKLGTNQSIVVKGGPNNQPGITEGEKEELSKQYPVKQGNSNIWDTSIYRNSNLYIDGTLGNTIEFWAKLEASVSGDVYPVVVGNENGNRIQVQFNTTTNKVSLVYTDDADVGLSGVSGETTITDLLGTTWAHYAFSFINSGSNIKAEIYKNGTIVGTITSGTNLGTVSQKTTYLLANGTAASTNTVNGLYLDEFRFWKRVRTAEEIGRYWLTNVNGGTNTDDNKYNTENRKVDLGIYYKFNEGITTDAAIDSTVLDYSGRISNGTITNYTTTARATTSAFDESGLFEVAEEKDFIIYSSHPDFISAKKLYMDTGLVYDYNNNSSIYHTLPAWIIEEDEASGENTKELTQVMSSYFDSAQVKIKELVSLKDIEYHTLEERTNKPYSLIRRTLESAGMIVPDLFTEASAFEEILSRGEQEKFEEKLQDVKNTIYQNIYNNLSYIYKSKGTEKAFRNLIRCFGIDDELLKVNMYSDGADYLLEDSRRTTAIKKKFVDFNNADRDQGLVYTKEDPSNASSNSYIRGVGYDRQPNLSFTFETEVIFPKRISSDHPGYDVPTNLEEHIAYLGEYTTSYSANDLFDLKAVKEGSDATSENVKFVLTMDGQTLETQFFKSVYENSKWNLAVRLVPKKSLSGVVSGGSTTDYRAELYCVRMLADVVEDEETVTADVTEASARALLAKDKYVSIGALRSSGDPEHTPAETDTLDNDTRVKISSTLFWYDNVTNEEIRAHASDASNFGRLHPSEEAYSHDAEFATIQVPKRDTLAMHWDFSEVSTTDGSGEFIVNDLSQGNTITESDVNQKSIQFLADGDTIDIADSDDLSFTDGAGTDRPFSISAWVKVGNIATDSGVIISRRDRDGTAPQLGEWLVEHVNGKLKVYLYADKDYNAAEITAFSTTNRLYFNSSVANLTSNNWHFITATYDGSESVSGLKVYKDGTEITTGKTVTNTKYSGMPNYNIVTTIGGTDTPTGNTFDDYIADTAVFNKALSSAEVTEIYNGGKVKDLSKASVYGDIISWWKMGDDLDTTGANGIKDYVGSNNGTLQGTAVVVSETPLSDVEYSGTYGWFTNLVGRQVTGRGKHFTNDDKQIVNREYVHSAKHRPPEVINSEDLIEIRSQDDLTFTKDAQITTHFFAAEKSMYQVISDDMINLFATIVEFNDLIGQPVNRYRMEYKTLEKFRARYFEKVNNVPSLEKYIELYKWIDSSIGLMIQELIPVSSNFSADLRNMVESHVLERNKYWTKFPTLEMPGEPPMGVMRGINELTYSWKDGTPTFASAFINFTSSTASDYDNKFITLIDSNSTTRNFVFDDDNTYTTGQVIFGNNIAVQVNGMSSTTAIAAEFVSAITATTSLAISAISADNSVTLVQDNEGVQGNTTITIEFSGQTPAYDSGSYSSFSGGRDTFLWKDQRVSASDIPTGNSDVDDNREILRKVATRTTEGMVQVVDRGVAPAKNFVEESKPVLRTPAGATYEGRTFANRALSKPYKLNLDIAKSVHGGVNYSAKTKDPNAFIRAATRIIPGNPATVGITPTLATNPVTYEEWKKLYTVKRSVTVTISDTELNLTSTFDGDTIYPYYGYRDRDAGIDTTAVISGHHNDSYGDDAEIPMQGPFTETWVGGNQHRHIHFTEQTPADRPEFYLDDSGILKHPQEVDSNNPAARYTRDEVAKRPVNIRNIKTNTTTNSPLGNYTRDYEVVQTSGRTQNNSFITKLSPERQLGDYDLEGYALFESTDKIDVASDSSLSFTNQNNNDNDDPFTISMWVNFTSPLDALSRLLEKSTEYQLSYSSSYGLTLQLTGGSFAYADASFSPTPGIWYHIAVTYNGDWNALPSSAVKIYINSVESSVSVGTSGVYDEMQAMGNVLRLGYSYEGKMRSTAIYDKVLSQGEVTEIYNQNDFDLSILSSYSNIISWWKLVHDAQDSVLTNHGTPTGIEFTSRFFGSKMNQSPFVVGNEHSGTDPADESTAIIDFVGRRKRSAGFTLPDRGRSEHVIVERFSAPGESLTMTRGYLDAIAEEFSPYSGINNRNSDVRSAYAKRLYTHSGFHEGSQGYESSSPVLPSVHKVNRNAFFRPLDTGCTTDYDNAYVSHQIPRSDLQYAFVTASIDYDKYRTGAADYIHPHHQCASGSIPVMFSGYYDEIHVQKGNEGYDAPYADFQGGGWRFIRNVEKAAVMNQRRTNTYSQLVPASGVGITERTVTSYIEPAVVWNKPNTHHVLNERYDTFIREESGELESPERMEVRRRSIVTNSNPISYSYSNNLEMFSNEMLTRAVDINKTGGEGFSETLMEIFKKAELLFSSSVAREIIFPKHKNVGLGKTRTRTKFDTYKFFWKDKMFDRVKCSNTTKLGYEMTPEFKRLFKQKFSVDVMDSFHFHQTDSTDNEYYKVIGDLTYMGEARMRHMITRKDLDLTDSSHPLNGTSSTGSFLGLEGICEPQATSSDFVPVYFSSEITRNKTAPIPSPQLYHNPYNENYKESEGWINRKPITSGQKANYNDYDSFSEEVKLAAQNYGLVSEFRISEHMDKYILENGGNFRTKNYDFLTLDGASHDGESHTLSSGTSIKETSTFYSLKKEDDSLAIAAYPTSSTDTALVKNNAEGFFGYNPIHSPAGSNFDITNSVNSEVEIFASDVENYISIEPYQDGISAAGKFNLISSVLDYLDITLDNFSNDESTTPGATPQGPNALTFTDLVGGILPDTPDPIAISIWAQPEETYTSTSKCVWSLFDTEGENRVCLFSQYYYSDGESTGSDYRNLGLTFVVTDNTDNGLPGQTVNDDSTVYTFFKSDGSVAFLENGKMNNIILQVVPPETDSIANPNLNFLIKMWLNGEELYGVHIRELEDVNWSGRSTIKGYSPCPIGQWKHGGTKPWFEDYDASEFTDNLQLRNMEHAFVARLGMEASSNRFRGLLDEFTMFRGILPSSSIAAIYNNGVPNNVNELVANGQIVGNGLYETTEIQTTWSPFGSVSIPVPATVDNDEFDVSSDTSTPRAIHVKGSANSPNINLVDFELNYTVAKQQLIEASLSVWHRIGVPSYDKVVTQGQWDEEFFNSYVHTDDINFIEAADAKHDELGLETTKKVRLKVNAIKKLLPYEGFYPQDRTVQLANLFVEKVSPDILHNEKVYKDQAIQAALQHFFAPGILYNSIKAGIACDWVTYTNESGMEPSYFGQTIQVFDTSGNPQTKYLKDATPYWFRLHRADVVDPYTLGSLDPARIGDTIPTGADVVSHLYGQFHQLDFGQKLDTLVTTNSPNKRLPFESLLNPVEYLLDGTNNERYKPDPSVEIYVEKKSNQHFLMNSSYYNSFFETIPSTGNYDEYCYPYFELSGDSAGKKDFRYELAMNNFLSETVKFFIKEEQLSSFSSRPENEFSAMTSGSTYYMDVALRQSKESSVVRSPGSLGGRYFGPPSGYVNTTEDWLFIDPKSGSFEKIEDPAYAPYTPPYFYGESVARIAFTATETKKYTLDEILEQSTVQYENKQAASLFRGKNLSNTSDTGAGSTQDPFDGDFENSAAWTSKMPLDSSINLFGKTKISRQEFDADGSPTAISSANNTELDTWVIYTKFECPLFDFSDSSNASDEGTLDALGINKESKETLSKTTDSGTYDYTSSYLNTQNTERFIKDKRTGSGIWAGYGKQQDGNGVTISIRESFPQGTSDSKNSLIEVCGFTPETKQVGRVADEKEITEAVVMIPFLDKPIRALGSPATVLVDDKNFIKINKLEYREQERKHNINGVIYTNEAGEEIRQTSITNMIEGMKKYNVPPLYDFETFENQDPFVMYFFEFKHTLDREDLSNIWQGVQPKIAKKAMLDSVEIDHEINKHEFFGNMGELPEGIRWMTFKVKRKAEKSYYKMTQDSRDDSRFKFDFEVGTKEPEYGYNYPYDYFTMLEMIQVEVNSEKEVDPRQQYERTGDEE